MRSDQSIIKIGFPFLRNSHGGPNVFLRRLRESIKRQRLAKTMNFLLPFYDVALFKSIAHNCFNRPYVLRVDGIHYDRKETLGSNEKLNEPIFRSIEKAAGVIYISDFARKLVNNFFQPVDKPYAIIHNAVNLGEFKASGKNYRRELSIRPNDRVLITSAHWRKWKRLEHIVKCFFLLDERSDQRYHLVILGKGADYIVEHQRIHYVGEVEPTKLPHWYRTGDIYIHLAWLEACGNTQVEAMGCGLPVLCTNEGGAREVVEKAQAGFIAQADEKYDFTLADLYNPPAPDYEIIAKDIEYMFDHYTTFHDNMNYTAIDIDMAARKYVDFIRECVDS